MHMGIVNIFVIIIASNFKIWQYVGLGRSPGEGKGYPFHSGLENSMDYSPWDGKESYTPEGFSLSLSIWYFSARAQMIILLSWLLLN